MGKVSICYDTFLSFPTYYPIIPNIFFPINFFTLIVMCNYQFDLTGVSVEDIIRKVAVYFELDNGIYSRGKSVLEKRINILRELYNCEFWLADQFCVKTFKSLGFGEFLMLLEKHASLLPDEIHKFLIGDICESPFWRSACFSISCLF